MDWYRSDKFQLQAGLTGCGCPDKAAVVSIPCLASLLSNIHEIKDIINWRTAKWRENRVFIIGFSSVVTALFSTLALPITTKLLLATGELFTLSADSSQEVILHASLLQQLWKCSLAAFLFPLMTAWQLLPESELDDLPVSCVDARELFWLFKVLKPVRFPCS